MPSSPEKFGPENNNEEREKNELTQENLEFTEEDLEKMVQEAEAQISTEEKEVLDSAQQRIDHAPESSTIDAQKAESIFVSSGIAERVAGIKEKIVLLGKVTKEKISDLFTNKPEIIHFGEMTSPDILEAPGIEFPGTETQSKEQPGTKIEELIPAEEPEKVALEEVERQETQNIQISTPEQATAQQEVSEMDRQEKPEQLVDESSESIEKDKTEQKYESVREYTREQTSEERKNLAEKIANLRREKFESDRELEQRLDTLLREAEGKKINAEEAVKQITESEEQLSQLRENLISRVVHFREIQKLERQVGEKKIDQEKFNEQYRETQELISSLDAQKGDRSKIEQAKSLLGEFYAGKEKEWLNFEKEEKDRDVKNVLEQYDVAMVHALISRGAPSENTLLRSDITWQEKLKIILAFEPTISTSTISPEQQATWRNMGVILSGGRVEAASSGDAGTQAKGLKNREVRKSNPEIYDPTGQRRSIETQLQNATSKRGAYNEIVVGNPEVAGFFIKIQEDGSIEELGDMDGFVSPNEVFKTVQEMNLPLFVIKGGEVYRSSPDMAEKVLSDPVRGTYKTIMKFGEKIPPMELAKLPGVLDKEKQSELAMEIMNDSPFKLQMEEAHYTDQMNGGRETYIGVNFNRFNLENAPMKIYQSAGRYEGNPDLIGKEMKIVGEVKSPEAVYTIVNIDGKLYTEIINKRTGERKFHDRLSGILHRGSIVAGVDSQMTYSPKIENEAIDSTEAYLDRMKIEIEENKERLTKAEKEGWEHGVNTSQYFLRMTAFHLFGYADEAMKYGDIESQEAANRLAMEILPREVYEDIVKRRIGPNGEFKVTKEDLGL